MSGLRWTVAAAIIATLGCAGGDDAPPGEESLEPNRPATTGAARPDTTPEALRAHLEQENYQSWPLFPGKGQLYTGTEPHGMLLTTYVNRIAHDALTRGGAVLPAGAIIVKENYMADSTHAGATVMYKAQGFDPANGDWYWAKYTPDGAVEDAGRVGMCQQCHAAARQRDYVMTPLPGN